MWTQHTFPLSFSPCPEKSAVCMNFPFHTQSRYYHLLPMSVFTFGMFQTGVFEHSTTLQKKNKVHHFENILNVLSTVIKVKKNLQIIAFCFKFKFQTASKLFLDLRCRSETRDKQQTSVKLS